MRKLALVLICSAVLPLPVVHGQTALATFAGRHDYFSSATSAVAMGDLNGDGIPDVVLGNGNEGAEVQFGNGDGTFRPGPNYSPGFGMFSIVLIDLNGDGKLDLIMAAYQPLYVSMSGLAVAFGNGDGTFSSSEIIPAGTDRSAYTLVTGDFNNDGILDAALLGEDGVWMYLGTGNGAFGPPTLTAVPSPVYSASSFAAADFNQDGRLDVIVGLVDGSYEVLLGNGDGGFETPTTFPGPREPLGMVVADFNGDGVPDVAMAALHTPADVEVFLGNGDGTFRQSTAIILPGQGFLVAGDLNGDGKIDLVSSLGYVAFGKGNGRFDPAVYDPLPGDRDDTGLESNRLALADLRGSGRLDIVSVSFLDTLSVLLNQGHGKFLDLTSVAVAGIPNCPVVADFNSDGIPDLAVVVGGSVSMYPGTGKASPLFGTPLTMASPNATCLVTGDLNKDGKPDLVVLGSAAAPNLSNLTTYLGNGDGTFAQASSVNFSVALGAAVLADFNHDGKLDIAFSANLIAFGNGDGTFQTAKTLTTALHAPDLFGNLAVADFNGDGLPDIATADTFNEKTFVLLNQGHGTFQMSTFYVTVIPTEVVATDINGDGVPDLVINGTGGNIGLYFGAGDGTFPTNSLLKAPLSFGGSMIVTDLNGDHKPDIGLVDESSFLVFTGNGDGTFVVPETFYGVGPSPGGVAAGAFHGQNRFAGTPDVVVTDSSGALELLLNTTVP